MIDNKIAELMELESYKKALIYEYVTGKKEAQEVIHLVENKEIRFEQDIETSLTTYGKWKKETFNESNFDPIAQYM